MLMLVVSLTASAQKHVVVFIQDYDIGNKSLYWNMGYGLEKFITWEKITDMKYREGNNDLTVYLYPDDEWIDVDQFIDSIKTRKDSTLYILVGHNQLFGYDDLYDTIHTNCSDNMLFGCETNRDPWKCIDNTLVNTNTMIAPEGYIVWPAIVGWIRGDTEQAIRNTVSEEYGCYQRIYKSDARLIFGVHN